MLRKHGSLEVWRFTEDERGLDNLSPDLLEDSLYAQDAVFPFLKLKPSRVAAKTGGLNFNTTRAALGWIDRISTKTALSRRRASRTCQTLDR